MGDSIQTTGSRNWTLSQAAFERLLDWLDSDREQAGIRYEDIRRKLIRVFLYRGCLEPEDLADETINRVARKTEDIIGNYVGDPIQYFYGVAHKIHHEYVRRKSIPVQLIPFQKEELETSYNCLEKCLEKLTANSRELILVYYSENKKAKIDKRKDLADQQGIDLNALRNRAHRVRLKLQDCVLSCLEQYVI